MVPGFFNSTIIHIGGARCSPLLRMNMKVPKKFWKEEAGESAHKDIKKELEKAAGMSKKKAKRGKPLRVKKLKRREHAFIK